MFGRRADRPQGEPVSIEVEVKRLIPSLGEGMANVYTMPETGHSRYVGSYDTWKCADELRRYQELGYLVYS